jgi:hypothetical protein
MMLTLKKSIFAHLTNLKTGGEETLAIEISGVNNNSQQTNQGT